MAELHPEAEGKPVVVGNCQAGWQILMTAATRPEVFGPIIVAGSPLSYWAGVRGVNPMRYSGGLLGGSWLTALAGDLGNGIFDGAWLVQNFEGMNPANTLWSKQYNLYSKIDTEPERYLGFEKWWGGHVLLNAEEMQYIVDNLFVGNKLATAGLVTADGKRIDLREIRSPIVCFCSKGDDITPPQQALGWITDLYASVDDIRAHGQTIVYCVHESVGHLGIFVSGGVAKKEHEEFASNIDFIDILPPGLYEAVITPREEGDADADLISGDYLIRFAGRDIDDVRAIVGTDPEDERRFAAAARISEINLGLYRSFMQPFVRATVGGPLAEWLRQTHPLRLQYELLSDKNPLMRPVADLAGQIREAREPAAADNELAKLEAEVSRRIVAALDGYRDLRDRWHEQAFLAVYGSSLLQALVGLRARDEPPRPRPGEDPDHRDFVERRKAELLEKIGTGGLREAALRALLYVLMPQRTADERTFNLLRRMRDERGAGITLAEFKAALREQGFMLLLDQERAVATLPQLLASASAEQIRETLGCCAGSRPPAGRSAPNPRPASRRSPASSRRPPRPRRRDGPRRRPTERCRRAQRPRGSGRSRTGPPGRRADARSNDQPRRAEVPMSANVLRPEDLHKITEDKEMAKVRESLAHKKKEDEEQQHLREAFMAGDVRPNVMDLLNAAVRRAAEQNLSELMVMSFPSAWCTDHGRTINNASPDWPESLQGRARKGYEFYEQNLKPLGYRLRAQVLNYPDGMPGDVGIYLAW